MNYMCYGGQTIKYGMTNGGILYVRAEFALIPPN